MHEVIDKSFKRKKIELVVWAFFKSVKAKLPYLKCESVTMTDGQMDQLHVLSSINIFVGSVHT